MIPQRHRRTDTDRDRQTTSDSKTALCTVVHRAVKKVSCGAAVTVGDADNEAVDDGRQSVVGGHGEHVDLVGVTSHTQPLCERYGVLADTDHQQRDTRLASQYRLLTNIAATTVDDRLPPSPLPTQ